MAKLNAPLFSFAASGKIAKALVYFGWKGLNVVRQYVVPANPRSQAQIDQRDLLRQAVDGIHTAQGLAADPLDAEDLTAYALYGSTFPSPRTWFNTIVKDIIDCMVADKSSTILCNGAVSTAVALKLTFSAALFPLQARNGHLYYGLSKTALVNSVEADAAGGAISVDIDPTVKGTRYYMQWRPDPGEDIEGMHSGIYHKIST